MDTYQHNCMGVDITLACTGEHAFCKNSGEVFKINVSYNTLPLGVTNDTWGIL